MAKAKKVVKKNKAERTVDAMQDTIIINTFLQMIQQLLEFDSVPYISYWPHNQSVELSFMEDRLDDEQMRKISRLSSWPQDGPMDGRPLYWSRVNTEVFDNQSHEMKQLVGKIEVNINIEFTEHDWEKMTKADRGSIINLEDDEK